jgi:ribonucleoside-diphosphate reductase alpha chain
MPYEIPENSLAETIFLDKYAYPGETQWKECARRVAKAASDPEFPEDRQKFEQKFFDAINSGDFMPGGRILFGSGRSDQNLLNCYVLDPEDSVESIGKVISDMYKISCGGGGIGFNFSKLRPKGDNIQNIPNSAPGSISVMRMINEIGNHVRAGKNRRTALMSILEVTHPDFLEFLHVKLDRKELTNFNISVGVTKRFIAAVENDEEWHFTFGGRQNQYFVYQIERKSELGDDIVEVVAKDESDAIGRAKLHHLKHYGDTFGEVTKKALRAREIWERIVDNAVESGEPGIFNIDFANEYTNVSYFERMPSTNPCGEEVLPAYGNCCLGHVNLANMVDMDGTIDWRRLARAIRTGVRFLDNILTANHFPIPECEEGGMRSRRIGLGVTGLHYFLIKAGYRYGSEDCLEFLERLFSTIRNEAYKASAKLGKEKGSFAAYDWNKLKNEVFFKTLPSRIRTLIRDNGLRNAILLTVAPTGTISMVLGVSTGLEPIFAPVYKRRWRTGTEGVWNETYVVDPLFKELYLRGRDVSHCVGAYDVTPEEHIKVQAVVQAYIDSAVSKTCNLPADFKPETLYDDLLMYANDLKGSTFYRASSRGNEPLEAVDISTINLDKLIVDGTVEEQVDSVDTCKSGVCEL